MASHSGNALDFGFHSRAEKDGDGWAQFVGIHRRLCVCGHREWEHMGFREPGCSHAGTCTCLRFRLALEKTA